jgi:hypothetical protein
MVWLRLGWPYSPLTMGSAGHGVDWQFAGVVLGWPGHGLGCQWSSMAMSLNSHVMAMGSPRALLTMSLDVRGLTMG